MKKILGLPDTLTLRLVNLSDEVDVHDIESAMPAELAKHPKLFDGKVGKLPVIYQMKTDVKLVPIDRLPRKIPYAMKY